VAKPKAACLSAGAAEKIAASGLATAERCGREAPQADLVNLTEVNRT